MDVDKEWVDYLSKRMHDAVMSRIPEVTLNGDSEQRYPGNLNFSFAYVEVCTCRRFFLFVFVCVVCFVCVLCMMVCVCVFFRSVLGFVCFVVNLWLRSGSVCPCLSVCV